MRRYLRPSGRRYATVILLVALPAMGSRLNAQVSFGLGATYQQVTSPWWSYGLFGSSFDLAVRTSRAANLIIRVQALGHDEDAEVDPVHLRSAEVGLQYVPARGRLLQLALGFGAGGYIRREYDASYSGPSLLGQARLSLHPVESVGLFVEGLLRGFGGEDGGTALGLAFGVSLGVNH